MDYEKKYNEALKWMRELYPGLHGATKEDAEHFFPELRESEDERIRKFICSIIDNLEPKDFVGVKKMNVLAWLEKQKELFGSGKGLYYYDGENTTYCGYPATEENPYDFAMTMSQLEKQKESLHISETCKENPDSFTDESEDKRIIQNLIDAFTEYKKSGGVDFHGIDINTLLSWLEKQKELDKMIVVSPEVWDNAISDAFENGKKEGEKQKEPHYTKRNAIFDKCVENCDPEVMKEVSNKVDEMLGKEQKPSCWNSPVMTHEMIMNEQKPAEWEDYKDKVNIPYCSSEPEWSEDDEKMRNLAIEWAETMSGQFSFVGMDSTDFRKIATWLKDLRPSWKPSEKQMKTLQCAIAFMEIRKTSDYDISPLKDLYEQLKKL